MSALLEPTAKDAELIALLSALTALRQGRDGVRLPPDWTGVAGRVADAFNAVVEQNERMAGELARLSRVVGKEGKLSQRLAIGDVTGFWRESVGSVNDLIDDLVHPTIETARVIGAVAQGDLSKKVALDVDDDMRNIFALSTILEEQDMLIVSADNGRDTISTLQSDAGIETVLMDIMMPEMDGMETMREVRKIPRLKNLPIVAVTAKAMKGDREKCSEAGAWDYLSKPVDPGQLLSVLQAWLQR